MANWRPSKPFATPMQLQVVTSTTITMGVTTRTYASAGIFFGSFTTYGGTEREVNGLVSVEDTAVIETWYRPDFAANCRIALANDPTKVYEIVGEPEDIEQRHQFCKMRVTRVRGGA